MDKNKVRWIVAGVAILILIVALASRKESAPTPGAEPSADGAQTGTSATGVPAKPSAGTPPAPGAAITTLAPTAGEEWVIGQVHEIKWSRPAGIGGGIALVDAASKNTVGWIHQSLSPNQTYFPWNTRDLFPGRTSPLKKDVAPGAYFIRIVFDGVAQASPSGQFSIIFASQAKTPVHAVSIKSYVLNPATITVKKGDKVVFTNNDGVTHQLHITGSSPLTIAPGASVTFETLSLFPGSYPLFSNLYPSLKGTLIVQ